jgi:hypothetical protein
MADAGIGEPLQEVSISADGDASFGGGMPIRSPGVIRADDLPAGIDLEAAIREAEAKKRS